MVGASGARLPDSIERLELSSPLARRRLRDRSSVLEGTWDVTVTEGGEGGVTEGGTEGGGRKGG